MAWTSPPALTPRPLGDPAGARTAAPALSARRAARRGGGAACGPERAGRRRLMRALGAGAGGFVGAAVARALVAAGWRVRGRVRAGSVRRNLQLLPVGMVAGDLADGAS